MNSPAIEQDIEKLRSITGHDYDIENRDFLRYFTSRYGVVLTADADPNQRLPESYYTRLRATVAADANPAQDHLRILKGQLQHAWLLFWEFAG